MGDTSPDNPRRIEATIDAIDAIEAELRSLGWFEHEAPPSEGPTGAFGAGAMSFEQWLCRVFVPSVRAKLASDGPWPDDSQVASQAYREWRMHGDAPGVDRLLELLQRFDALFGPGHRP